ncbi:hypothetical protein NB231_12581 [Nitrococcus mobilis Nb-231]|uniref:Uncharacterized protein n=1 Tax=Nitrococcus mobilis Nb-231 TaxID=314278 RepID=A4BU51_9GAMM|nr:hypothetical protein NB231_12581 [Nitrococcus mobilis Nb-231]
MARWVMPRVLHVVLTGPGGLATVGVAAGYMLAWRMVAR